MPTESTPNGAGSANRCGWCSPACRFTNAQNQVIATAPSVALSFDPRSVFRGVFLPTSIVVDRPTLDVEIAREGGMMRRILANSDSAIAGRGRSPSWSNSFSPSHNRNSLLGQLDTVLVERARVTLRDTQSGVSWVAPAARARLKRDADGVIITANARFSSGGDPIDVSLSGTYARDRSRIVVEAKIDGLKPSMFADLSPDAALLRGVDIALSGRLRVEASGAGDIRTVAIEVTGGNGTVTLPGVLPATHQVRSVNARVSGGRGDAHRQGRADRHRYRRRQGLGHGHRHRRRPKGRPLPAAPRSCKIPVDRLGDYWPLEFAPGGRAMGARQREQAARSMSPPSSR